MFVSYSIPLHYGANLISFIGDNNTGISEAIPDEVEVYFVGIIGEGIAASQVSSQNWVGSMQYWNIQVYPNRAARHPPLWILRVSRN